MIKENKEPNFLQRIYYEIKDLSWISWNRYFVSLFLAVIYEYSNLNFLLLPVVFTSIKVYLVFTLIDAVSNRPKLIFNNQINDAIEELFNETQKGITLISAYMYFGKKHLNELELMLKNGIEVNLLFNSENLEKVEFKEQVKKLLDAGAYVYHNPNIHT